MYILEKYYKLFKEWVVGSAIRKRFFTTTPGTIQCPPPPCAPMCLPHPLTCTTHRRMACGTLNIHSISLHNFALALS